MQPDNYILLLKGEVEFSWSFYRGFLSYFFTGKTCGVKIYQTNNNIRNYKHSFFHSHILTRVEGNI